MLRCDLLSGMTIDEVVGLLGPADESYQDDGRFYRDYLVGPERDSFIQIDGGYFSIKSSPAGEYRAARYYQG